MAIISQHSLFSWQEIEELGDLERLRLLFENIPDEPLMRELESGEETVAMIIQFVLCGT